MQANLAGCDGVDSEVQPITYHLSDVISAYEYNYTEADKNIALLLDYAGAFEKDFSECQISDLEFQGKNNAREFVEVIEKLKTKEARVAAILHELWFENFTDAHNYLGIMTQQLFYNRAGERWDSHIPQWIGDHLSAVIDSLEEMHSCDEIIPVEKEYDCIAVFGANSYEMEERLKFTYSLKTEHGINYNNIFLLTGQRYVDNRVDSDYLIDASASHFNISKSEVTEAHLMEKLHLGYTVNNDMKNIPFYVIDSLPRADRSRPTTKDTIEDFVEDSHFAKCSSVVFVSRNPNVYAQGEDAHKLMPELASKVTYELAGGGCRYDEVLPLNAAYHGVMPIAGAMYGGWERVEKLVTGKSNIDKKSIKPSGNCVVPTLEQKLGIY